MRLMMHPGVGPITALAYVLIIGTPTRCQRGKQIGTYVGMIPCEEASARKQRLGHFSKQGSSLASCCWKQPRRRHGSTRTGGVGTCTWRCVDTKHCQSCDGTADGGMVVIIRHR
jgi:transposase